MERPASRTSVFNPFSVSSFAAQPPVIPEPTMIASNVFVAAMLAPCRTRPESGTHLLATVLRAGDNLQLQFLRESNFRGVIAVQRNVPEDVVEVSLQLGVELQHRVAMLLAPLAALRCRVIVHGAKEGNLLRRCCVNKVFCKEVAALLVHAGKTCEKILPLLFGGPFVQNNSDKLFKPAGLRAGSIGFWNDQVRHHHNRGILVRIQGAQLVPGTSLRLRLSKKRRQGRRK